MHYISPVNITKGKIAHYSFKYSDLLLSIFCFANTNYTQFHFALFNLIATTSPIYMQINIIHLYTYIW